MTFFTSFVYVLAVATTTVTSVHALPISTDHEQIRKRSAYSKKDVTMGFGIAIGIILFAMIMFYLGLRRGQSGTWFWWRTRTPQPTAPAATPKSQSRSASPWLSKLSRANTAPSVSTIDIATPKPVHTSSLSVVSPIEERPEPQSQPTSRNHNRQSSSSFALYAKCEPPIYELGDTSPTRPLSVAKSMTKSEWMRTTYLSTRSMRTSRRSRFLEYRVSDFSTVTVTATQPSRKTSFEDWRAEYAPSRRGTIRQHRRQQSSQAWLCKDAALLDKEVDVAIFEVEEDSETEVASSSPESRLSQDTLVTPVSPTMRTFNDEKDTDCPLPLLIRLQPTVEEYDEEWEYSSSTDVGEEYSSGSDTETDDEDHDEFEYDSKLNLNISTVALNIYDTIEVRLDDDDDVGRGRVFIEEDGERGPDDEIRSIGDFEKEFEAMMSHGDVQELRRPSYGNVQELRRPSHTRLGDELVLAATPIEQRGRLLSNAEEGMDWTGMEYLRRVYTQRKGSTSNGLHTVYIGDH